jgi:hypothetical protein
MELFLTSSAHTPIKETKHDWRWKDGTQPLEAPRWGSGSQEDSMGPAWGLDIQSHKTRRHFLAAYLHRSFKFRQGSRICIYRSTNYAEASTSRWPSQLLKEFAAWHGTRNLIAVFAAVRHLFLSSYIVCNVYVCYDLFNDAVGSLNHKASNDRVIVHNEVVVATFELLFPCLHLETDGQHNWYRTKIFTRDLKSTKQEWYTVQKDVQNLIIAYKNFVIQNIPSAVNEC